MTGLARFAVLLFAVLYQATVSPLFPVAGTQGDVLLVTLALFAVYGGPKSAMWAIPLGAVLLAILTGRSPGLLLIGYLPLLPLLVLFEASNLPLGNYARTAAAVVLTGFWSRVVLVAATLIQGGNAGVSLIAIDLLLPGIFLDFALLTLVYVPQRALRWRQASMRLERGGYEI